MIVSKFNFHLELHNYGHMVSIYQTLKTFMTREMQDNNVLSAQYKALAILKGLIVLQWKHLFLYFKLPYFPAYLALKHVYTNSTQHPICWCYE